MAEMRSIDCLHLDAPRATPKAKGLRDMCFVISDEDEGIWWERGCSRDENLSTTGAMIALDWNIGRAERECGGNI